jgi:hypothetical protein
MSSEKYYGVHARIETQRGFFDLRAPTFDIVDIAGGLARKCRFNGQCSRFYSVASHSLMVSEIMQNLALGDPLEGLLHDGNEAYLPDVPSPYKKLLPELGKLEDTIDALLRKHFNIEPKKSSGCKYADCVALMIEAFDLLPSRGTGPLWEPLAEFREPAMRLRARGIVPDYRGEVPTMMAFLKRYEELTRCETVE